MATEQRTLLVGQLTRALVHEVNHQLTPILFALEELRSQCRRVEQELERSVEEARREMVETQEALGKLSVNLHNLSRTTRLFGRISVQDSEGVVRIDHMVARSLEVVQDMADRAHVTLELILPDQILLLQAKESLLQQILLNLLINAVQQIALLRPQEGGRVRVMLAKEPAPEGGTLIHITVEDDGPGIHWRQWNEIFELGMTTRADGSGLGLYLAQRLCEEMHGRVYVDESAMLWGTRFVVEIPVRL
ncbi:MAG: hypothetical protein KatS3mg050_4998 [Litorilinea sp.]|nr:MAG: hypothetical protein KatS3mg050_4998 [Litorilinea sp.]